jgi:hypothetical protein
VYRHRFDPSSLIAGALFLVFALRYLVAGLTGHPVAYVWAGPAAVVTLGVILLLRLMFLSRRRER